MLVAALGVPEGVARGGLPGSRRLGACQV